MSAIPFLAERIIYIVTGSTGEYSDRTEWTVRAFENEADAKAFVEMADAWAREWFNRHQDARWTDEAENDRPAHDPDFRSDYTGTSYYMSACPMARAS